MILGIFADMQCRIQHDDYKFDYSTRFVDVENPLGLFPDWIDPVIERMRPYYINEEGVQIEPDQMTVQEYLIGKGMDQTVFYH